MNLYKPFRVKIDKREEIAFGVNFLRLKKTEGDFKKNKEGLVFNPGQFILLSNFGYGEAPFGGASSPYEGKYLDLVIREAGELTKSIHNLKKGDSLFLRGPYGNGFPLNFMRGKDIIMVSGGCGIPPIASLAEYIIANRRDYKRVYLVYGAQNPDSILLKKQMQRWKKDIEIVLTVDEADSCWSGHVGMVTEIVDDIEINYKNAVVAMCGPGPMADALEKVLKPLGIPDRRIFVSMERNMQCGIGKCQHCVCGDYYICQDGPVLNFDQIQESWD